MNRIGQRTLVLMAIWEVVGIVAISLSGCQGNRMSAAPLGDQCRMNVRLQSRESQRPSLGQAQAEARPTELADVKQMFLQMRDQVSPTERLSRELWLS